MESVSNVNVVSTANSLTEMFKYLKVGQLNDHMLNIVQGENRTLEFHSHEDSDEMFFVIEGEMQIEFKDRIVDMQQGDFLIVPKGMVHRPVCKSFVKILLIEKTGTLNKENTGGTYS